MAVLKHLTEYHKKAIELKYKGKPYADIASALSQRYPDSRKRKSGRKMFSEQTIKDWFKEGGPLQVAYEEYAHEADAAHQEAVSAMKKAGMRIREENYRLANEMLVALMGSQNDSVKLAAIKEILDRIDGKVERIVRIGSEEWEQMTQWDRLALISYETRLELFRHPYTEEAIQKVMQWIVTGKVTAPNETEPITKGGREEKEFSQRMKTK